MFGRSLHSFTTRNFNPILKNLEKARFNASFSISNSEFKSQVKTANEANYSTQSKSYRISEIKIDDDPATPKPPTSPPVFNYSLPITTIISIMNRITGIALGLGLAAIFTTAFLRHKSVKDTIGVIHSQYPLLMYPLKFCVIFPLTYNICTGIQHLVWGESQKGIKTEISESIGKLILGVVGIVTLFFTFFSN